MRKAIGKIAFGLALITGASWVPVGPSMLGPSSVSATTEEPVYDCKLFRADEDGKILCAGSGTDCTVVHA